MKEKERKKDESEEKMKKKKKKRNEHEDNPKKTSIPSFSPLPGGLSSQGVVEKFLREKEKKRKKV